MSEDKQIKNLEHLKKLASRSGGVNIYIGLQGGARSGKQVDYDPETDTWYVFQEIDGADLEYNSTQEFKEDYSLFFEALEKGCLWRY
jgi:hypothetical protein